MKILKEHKKYKKYDFMYYNKNVFSFNSLINILIKNTG